MEWVFCWSGVRGGSRCGAVTFFIVFACPLIVPFACRLVVVSSLFFHFGSCVVPVGTTVGGFAFGPKEHLMHVSFEVFVVGGGGGFGFCMLWDFGVLPRPHTCTWYFWVHRTEAVVLAVALYSANVFCCSRAEPALTMSIPQGCPSVSLRPSGLHGCDRQPCAPCGHETSVKYVPPIVVGGPGSITLCRTFSSPCLIRP